MNLPLCKDKGSKCSKTQKWLRNKNLTSKLLGFPGGSLVKNLPANAGEMGSIPSWEDALEKEMAIHSSILAWEIPWTEEPGRPQSIGSQKSQTQLSI